MESNNLTNINKMIKYIVGDFCISADVYQPSNSTLLRFPANYDINKLESLLNAHNINALYYIHRNNEKLIFIPYPSSTVLGLDENGTKETFVPFSPERNCESGRLINMPPKYQGVLGKSDQVAPYLDEAILFDYKLYNQNNGYNTIPEDFKINWLTAHPDFPLIAKKDPQNITGSISDANLMFIILFFALLIIIFLASRTDNWLQYHD